MSLNEVDCYSNVKALLLGCSAIAGAIPDFRVALINGCVALAIGLVFNGYRRTAISRGESISEIAFAELLLNATFSSNFFAAWPDPIVLTIDLFCATMIYLEVTILSQMEN